jgi:hypothetical protein
MTAVAPDFGLDVWCTDDLDPTAREVNGIEALMQAQLRRLDTPREGLVDDDDYGYPLIQLVSKGMTKDELAAVPANISAEFTKDQRISSVVTTVVLSTDSTLRLRFRVNSTFGPFSSTVEIGGALAVILNVQKEAP